MSRWSSAHRKTAIFGWLAFVVVAVIVGQMVGQKEIFGADQFNGESGRAERALQDAGLRPNDEVVLVQSGNSQARLGASVKTLIVKLKTKRSRG